MAGAQLIVKQLVRMNCLQHHFAGTPAGFLQARTRKEAKCSQIVAGQTQNVEKQGASDAGWVEKLFPGEIQELEKKRRVEKEETIRQIQSLLSQVEDAAIDAEEVDYRRTKSLKPKRRNGHSGEVAGDSLSFLSFLEQLKKSQEAPERVVLELDFLESEPEQPVSDEAVSSSQPSKFTVQSLKATAKARGLSGYSKLRKEELLQLLGLED